MRLNDEQQDKKMYVTGWLAGFMARLNEEKAYTPEALAKIRKQAEKAYKNGDGV